MNIYSSHALFLTFHQSMHPSILTFPQLPQVARQCTSITGQTRRDRQPHTLTYISITNLEPLTKAQKVCSLCTERARLPVFSCSEQALYEQSVYVYISPVFLCSCVLRRRQPPINCRAIPFTTPLKYISIICKQDAPRTASVMCHEIQKLIQKYCTPDRAVSNSSW